MIVFFISTAIIITSGCLGGILYARYIYPHVFGGMKISILVGISGGIIGGFVFDLLFKTVLFKWIINIPYFGYLLVNPVDINFIALFLGIWFFLAIYQYASEHTERS